jgi:hypothetical protein
LDVVSGGNDGAALVDTNATASYISTLYRRKRKVNGGVMNVNKMAPHVGSRAQTSQQKRH